MIKQAIYLLFIFLFLSVNSCSKDHGKNNGMADSDRDAYWSHPKKSFEKRRQLYLDYSAARPVTSNKAPFPQIARLELDLPIDEEIIRNSIDEIYLQQGGNNFTLGGLIRMKYLYGDGIGITQALKEDIESCLLDFKYWWDEPGRDKRCYHTENHQIVFHATELMADQVSCGYLIIAFCGTSEVDILENIELVEGIGSLANVVASLTRRQSFAASYWPLEGDVESDAREAVILN